jgi:hypothetical protein
MNYKYGWKKRKLREGEKDPHPMVKRQCMGYRSELIEIDRLHKNGNKMKVWIQERCTETFQTRDDTKYYCSSKCRVGRHRMMKKEE